MKSNCFCIVLCILFLSCGNNGNSKISNPENSITVNGTVEQQKLDNPEFLFENLSYDFGEITQGDQMNYIFYFKNVGNSNLLIYNVKATCGCTSSTFSEAPILPEAEGEIVVIFDSKGKSGRVSNYVVVSANTYPANVVLTLSANVVTP
jgi:hypothetical protein